MIYTPASSSSTISLAKSQWKSKTRNLLPDDKHFNSRQLLRLFLKPNARMSSRRLDHGHARLPRHEEIPEGERDEVFWARKENHANETLPGSEVPAGNYDANFFQDDAVGFPNGPLDEGDDFADAQESFSPAVVDPGSSSQAAEGEATVKESQDGAFGSQLVTQSRRLRPEYVQYARVAKKVDVRRLKEEMWRGISLDDVISDQQAPLKATPAEEIAPLKFTSIMNDLQQVYPKQAMDEISTSYCFICLLHLANEKGLSIGNEPDLQDLSIRRDLGAEVSEIG